MQLYSLVSTTTTAKNKLLVTTVFFIQSKHLSLLIAITDVCLSDGISARSLTEYKTSPAVICTVVILLEAAKFPMESPELDKQHNEIPFKVHTKNRLWMNFLVFVSVFFFILQDIDGANVKFLLSQNVDVIMRISELLQLIHQNVNQPHLFVLDAKKHNDKKKLKWEKKLFSLLHLHSPECY